VIFPRVGGWGAAVIDKKTGKTHQSQRPLATTDEAKLAAFDKMTKLKDERTKVGPVVSPSPELLDVA
jgi:hypothetical protein